MGKPKSRVCNVIVPGLLEQYAPGFRSWLLDTGYTPLTTVPQLQLMAHVSRWLEREGLTAAGLTGQQARRFLAARRAAGRPRHPAGLRPLLDYLRGLGAIPPEPREPPVDAASVLIAEFADYLRSERGLAPMTVGAYSSRAARFLARYAPDGDPAVIAPGDVTSALLADASGLSAGAGQHLACALRAFLRYCHVRGLVSADVSAAALGVTGRRTTMLPRGLEPGTIEALLAACDRAEPPGRRDYAVILLLARLGLRAGEAARLRLDDISWRAGEIGIRGKGGQYDVLPLPADVGAAIAAWLRDGRPAVSSREAFTTVTAPTRPLTREAVGWIVRRTCARAGLEAFGPHRLRHSAACAMIGAKVPLAGIAQAMRHRSHGVTAVYARAGIDRLRPLARPWPGTPAQPEGETS
jgi:site-specific recombinase XerD